MSQPSADDSVFFFDSYIPLCEQAFCFNYFVTGNITRSFSCLHRVTQECYEDIKTMEDTDQHLPYFIKNCWQHLAKHISSVKSSEREPLLKGIFALSPATRGQLAAEDCLGFSSEEVKEIFADDADNIEDSRKKLAGDKDFSEVIKPKIQDFFRRAVLQDKHRQELRELILPGYDVEVARAGVTRKVESTLRREHLRNYLILGVCFIVFGVIVSYFQTRPDNESRVIEWLGYETLAIEEEPERLDFPSNDITEIKSYFANHRGLSFEPKPLHLSAIWVPQGAGVIDYDFVRVAVVKYRKRYGESKANGKQDNEIDRDSDDRGDELADEESASDEQIASGGIDNEQSDELLFHYSFKGKPQNLAASEETRLGDFAYRTWASDELNMITWPHEQVISVLAGHLSMQELIELGRNNQLQE